MNQQGKYFTKRDKSTTNYLVRFRVLHFKSVIRHVEELRSPTVFNFIATIAAVQPNAKEHLLRICEMPAAFTKQLLLTFW